MKNLNKTLVCTIACVLAVLMFTGCPDPSTNTNTNTNTNSNSSTSNDVTNNLSESKGENELSGNTYTCCGKSFQFTDTQLTISNTTKNDNARSKATAPLATFNYSYDSESKQKTLELQVASVLDSTGAGQDYSAQLAKAKASVASAQTAILAAVNNDTLYTNFDSFSTSTGGKVTSAIVKNAVVSLTQEYIDAQNEILTEYLKQKYNAVIKLKYNLEGNDLNLTEIFQGDITNASACFKGDSITLNDYTKLIPFAYTDNSNNVYAGVPSITASTDTTGTISVDLYPLLSDVDASSCEISSEKITAKVSAITTALSDFTSKASENMAGTTSVEDVIAESFKEVIAGHTFTATYTIDTDNKTLTLKPTVVPSIMSGVTESTEITLNYYATFQSAN